MLGGCSDDTPDKPTDEENYVEKPLALDKGIYLLNGGNEADGPGGLTRINEDGSVTTRLFEDVNGHPIGKRVRCMAAYGDDIYFLCSTFKSIGFAEDTILVVADAKTLKEKRAYKFKDLSFDMPEGTKPEDEPFPSDPESIYVLDEANIFIKESRRSSASTARRTRHTSWREATTSPITEPRWNLWSCPKPSATTASSTMPWAVSGTSSRDSSR